MGIFAKYLTWIKAAQGSNQYSDWSKVNYHHLNEFKKDLNNSSEHDIADLKSILLICIKCGYEPAMEFSVVIVQTKKLISWKRQPELVAEMLDLVIAQCDNAEVELRRNHYEGFMSVLVTVMRNNQLFHQNVAKFIIILQKATATEENIFQKLTRSFTSDLPWANHPETALEFMATSMEMYQKYPDARYYKPLAYCINGTWKELYRYYIKNLKTAIHHRDTVARMFLCCKQQGWDNAGPGYGETGLYKWLCDCFENYLDNHKDCTEIIQPVFQACVELSECEDETLQQKAHQLLVRMPGANLVELDQKGHVTDSLIQRYLTGDEPDLIGSLASMYTVRPEKLNRHLDAIAKDLENGDTWLIHSIIDFFRTVCMKHPEEMTPKAVLHLVSTLHTESTMTSGLNVLVTLAEKQPELMLPHEDDIIECILSQDMCASLGAPLLVHVSIAYPDKVERHLEVLKSVIEKAESSNYRINPLYNMRIIGQKYPAALAKHETFFKELNKDRALKVHLSMIMDILAGRSLEVVSRDVQVVQQDVKELDDRVTHTEENVTNLGFECDNTDAEVTKLKQGLDSQHQCTAAESSPLSNKQKLKPECYSHVAKVLNQSDKDGWKFLASRLGYSISDIRTFAGNPQPCVSVLESWFRAHSYSEAVLELLKHLEELCGSEAYPVVREILQQTDIDSIRSKTATEKHDSRLTKATDYYNKAEILQELSEYLDEKLEAMKLYVDTKFDRLFTTKKRTKPVSSKPKKSNDLEKSFV